MGGVDVEVPVTAAMGQTRRKMGFDGRNLPAPLIDSPGTLAGFFSFDLPPSEKHFYCMLNIKNN